MATNYRRDLRLSLGMTQIEMAALLGVNRAQWSMYESGRRSLPVAALQVLAAVSEKAKSTSETDARTKQLSDKAQSNHDKKRLKEVEYKLVLAQRELDAENRKQTNRIRRDTVREIVETMGMKVGDRPIFVVKKETKNEGEKSAEHLIGLKHRVDCLRMEQAMLTERLKMSRQD